MKSSYKTSTIWIKFHIF